MHDTELIDRGPMTAVLSLPPGRSKREPLTLEEQILLKRAKKGDPEAYGKLFEGYADRLRRMASLVLPPQFAAEDVVQETFVRGLTRLESYRGEGDLCSWLISIAINICRHQIRTPKRKMELSCEEALNREQHFGRARARGTVTKAVEKEDSRLLRLAMGHLTKGQREVFVLHYKDGIAYEEIGRMLDMRAGAARALAHRAKARLREKLGVCDPFSEELD